MRNKSNWYTVASTGSIVACILIILFMLVNRFDFAAVSGIVAVILQNCFNGMEIDRIHDRLNNKEAILLNKDVENAAIFQIEENGYKVIKVTNGNEAVCDCGKPIELVDNSQCKKCQSESSEAKAN